jgi:hypothetical protein
MVDVASDDEVAAWLDYARNRYVSLKSRDAVLLLEGMQRAVDEGWQPHQANFKLEHTVFLERLLNEVASEKGGSSDECGAEEDN